MQVINKFKIGDLVVIKTHPLLNDFRIRGDGKTVPPILMVKEVNIENKKKKLCDGETGNIIAERIKYTCLYFNDNKNEFIESILYETMLESYNGLKIEKINEKGDVSDNSKTIIKEIDGYKIPKYEYGKIVRFKTKKIEIYKKRSSKKFPVKNKKIEKKDIEEVVQYVTSFTSPDLIICGYSKNEIKNLYYPNGHPQRLVSSNLFKVKWFNSVQQKFSEQYIPEELLTDEMTF